MKANDLHFIFIRENTARRRGWLPQLPDVIIASENAPPPFPIGRPVFCFRRSGAGEGGSSGVLWTFP